MSDIIHSNEYLHADSRQDWWNGDFLDLLVRRFQLASVCSLADIGCGTGYLSRMLLPRLPSLQSIFGLDREAAHIAEASAWFSAQAADRAASPAAGQPNKPAPLFSFVQGDALAIPLPDNSVDLAICQTLLIHVADPRAVLAEMRRITRPGGIIIALEPNNAVQSVIRDLHIGSNPPSIEKRLADIEFALRVETGKAALGEGDNSLGDHLAWHFAELGINQLQVYLNDQVVPLIPPYSRQAQNSLRDEMDWISQGQAHHDPAVMRRWFLAGGGGEAQFQAAWDSRQQDTRQWQSSCQAGRYYSPGASLMYVVGGIK